MGKVEKERLQEAGWNGTEQNLGPDPRFDVLRHKKSPAYKIWGKLQQTSARVRVCIIKSTSTPHDPLRNFTAHLHHICKSNYARLLLGFAFGHHLSAAASPHGPPLWPRHLPISSRRPPIHSPVRKIPDQKHRTDPAGNNVRLSFSPLLSAAAHYSSV